MQKTLQGIVKTKMGMMALTGSQLLKQKEAADKALLEELKFLKSCFLESPNKARAMTRLRLAEEVSDDVLKRYELLRGVEPTVIYHRVGNVSVA